MRTTRTPTPNRAQLLGRSLAAFVTAPASALPLAVLRISLAVVLLARALTLSGSLLDLYGSLGFLQRPLVEAVLPDNVPRLGWLVDALQPYDVSEPTCIWGVFLAYLAGVVGLLLGWQTRWAAALAWSTHFLLMQNAVLAIYGVDYFVNIVLFYCLWMPVGHVASLDRRAGRASGGPTRAARLSLRVLQVHLCLVYLSSGLWKASGSQWWDGEAIWRALMRTDLGPFDLTVFEWLADVPWVARLVCWGTLLVEIGYALFIWPRWTRRVWAWATLGLHAGIALCLGLWSFSAVMMVLTGSAFLVSAEPRAIPVPAGITPGWRPKPSAPLYQAGHLALAP